MLGIFSLASVWKVVWYQVGIVVVLCIQAIIQIEPCEWQQDRKPEMHIEIKLNSERILPIVSEKRQSSKADLYLFLSPASPSVESILDWSFYEKCERNFRRQVMNRAEKQTNKNSRTLEIIQTHFQMMSLYVCIFVYIYIYTQAPFVLSSGVFLRHHYDVNCFQSDTVLLAIIVHMIIIWHINYI